MFIETDGTVTSREALEQSIEIMIHQLKAVIGFQDQVVEASQSLVQGCLGSGGGSVQGSTSFEDLASCYDPC